MIKKWVFPAGERGLKIESVEIRVNDRRPVYYIACNFRGSDDIIDIMLEADAARRLYGQDVKLVLSIPYFPYARQDRVMTEGESHSLKVIANLINSIKFSKVLIADPHSDVVEALVDNAVIQRQHDLVLATVPNIHDYDFLIAPDAGALKKIYKLSQMCGIPVICASKTRDVSTGEITGTKIQPEDYLALSKSKRALVVDDICDGGRTFIELSKVLPSACALDLYVTHGIFSKGKDALLREYRNVLCYNDLSVNVKDENV